MSERKRWRSVRHESRDGKRRGIAGWKQVCASVACGLLLLPPAAFCAEDSRPGASAMNEESLAHRRSAFARIDPAAGIPELTESPLRPDAAPWLYGDGELESFRLQILRRRAAEAKLKIGYPGEFHVPARRAMFRRRVEGGEVLSARVAGKAEATIAGRSLCVSENGILRCAVPSDLAGDLILTIESKDGIPALLAESGPLSTEADGWKWSADGRTWERPVAFAQRKDGAPPHCAEIPSVVMRPVAMEDGLCDFGVELIGRLVVRGKGTPSARVGESREEAMDARPETCEQPLEFERIGDGVWRSSVPAAFRFVRLDGMRDAELECLAEFHPAKRRGAFACSDPTLTRIWSHGAYTLRLCMRDFLLDGIKRDRLPWAGDLMTSLLTNAHSFRNEEIARRTLTVLGRAGIAKSHVNGIVDYSLWWIVCHDVFQLYSGDRAYLRREWPRIAAHMRELERRCDAQGFLSVAPGEWVFIDWAPGEKTTSLQILWRWALRSAARLAERLDETEAAERWARHADAVEALLQKTAWDAERGVWLGVPGVPKSRPTRQAQLLSVVSGLIRPDQRDAVRAKLISDSLPPVGTPYMAGFECMALYELGAAREATARIANLWGGMLARGATTFWEAGSADDSGGGAYAFYGRPFGKSLCHAWSAGPTAFLPEGLFGLKPLEDGWKRFEIDPPAPEILDWIAATVPTPAGDAELLLENGVLSLRLPPGVVAVCRGRELRSGATVDLRKAAEAPR